MSADQELVVMGKVLSEMECLDVDQRRRVLDWVAQKLNVEFTPSRSNSVSGNVSSAQSKNMDLSTDTIATVLKVQSGPELIMAAAANLHFVQAKQRFSRQELTSEMRSAPAHFKETFVNNLSKYLAGLTKADRLRLVASDTYALSSKERQGLETKLVAAA